MRTINKDSSQWSVVSEQDNTLVTGHWPLLTVRGQVVAEYFILFAVVAVLTLIGFTRFEFNDHIKTSLEGFVNAAANAITN